MDIKPGEQTTEFAAAKSSGFWGVVAMLLGLLLAILPQVQGNMSNAKASILVGGIVAIAGCVQKCLVDLGYIKSRTDVKTAASEAEKP